MWGTRVVALYWFIVGLGWFGLLKQLNGGNWTDHELLVVSLVDGLPKVSAFWLSQSAKVCPRRIWPIGHIEAWAVRKESLLEFQSPKGWSLAGISSWWFVYCWRALFAGNESNLKHGWNIANNYLQTSENIFHQFIKIRLTNSQTP